MKNHKLIFTAYLFCLVGFNSFAQNSEQSFDLFGNLKKENVIDDLNVLETLLLEVHPGINKFMTSEQVHSTIDSIKTSLPEKISGIEFHSKIAFILAQMKDGHTFIPWQEAGNSLDKEHSLLFPFHVTVLNDSYYIRNSVNEKYKKYIGYQILSINKREIKNVIKRILTYCSIEGKNISSYDYKLYEFPVKYFLIVDTASSFTMVLQSSTGKTETIQLKGVTFAEQDAAIYKTVPAVEYKLLDNSMALLKINSFIPGQFGSEKLTYAKYFESFFSMLRKKKIKKLILDLRGNEGGEAEVANELFSWLYRFEYYYFDYKGLRFDRLGEWKAYLKSNFYPILDTTKKRSVNELYCYTEKDAPEDVVLGKLKGKKKAFKGKVLTLIDGGCYSTTGHFISLLKYYNVATLIGKCSHGSYYSNDGAVTFGLPNSKLQVRIPVTQFKMKLANFEYDAKGICPDIEIEQKPEDLKKDFDRQFNEAINYFIKK